MIEDTEMIVMSDHRNGRFILIMDDVRIFDGWYGKVVTIYVYISGPPTKWKLKNFFLRGLSKLLSMIIRMNERNCMPLLLLTVFATSSSRSDKQ